MNDQDRAERRSEWMKAEEMARLTGASVATVKRRCEDGKAIRRPDGSLVPIQSERVQRPQGWEWRVRAMIDVAPLSQRSEQNDQKTPSALRSDAHTDQRALDILEVLLHANAATMDRQAEQIERLTREVWQRDGDARVAQSERDRAIQERDSAQAALTEARKRMGDLAGEVGQYRADALINGLERDQARRERDDLAEDFDDARALIASLENEAEQRQADASDRARDLAATQHQLEAEQATNTLLARQLVEAEAELEARRVADRQREQGRSIWKPWTWRG